MLGGVTTACLEHGSCGHTLRRITAASQYFAASRGRRRTLHTMGTGEHPTAGLRRHEVFMIRITHRGPCVPALTAVEPSAGRVH